jgi:DNA-binding NtrC family response regulator
MKYLLYYIEGFIKKFPLKTPSTTIGRSNENDLVIREDFISRNHVQIDRFDDYIMVKDLKSTNGINIRGERVKEALVRIGESFILGKMEFVLKEGSLDEFKLARELIPIFDTIGSENEKAYDDAKTRCIEDIYTETLKVVMQVGLKKSDFKDFVLDLSNYLSNLTEYGSLFIISQQGRSGAFDILLSVKQESLHLDVLKNIVTGDGGIYSEQRQSISLPGDAGSDDRWFSYPLESESDDRVLIFILNGKQKNEEAKICLFLSQLATEIDLLYKLLKEEGKKVRPNECLEELPGDMVAENSKMKELIQQARKIGASDIFVLIQGESGTGKELFARLIHNCSRRASKRFVGLNCAAIPENLLESELFGNEKGAFTGAYTQKKGKLEIASGGTLVLDEIGDMPMNLQAKLLRAIQEKEFYRLGGGTPITVDLRIISITNMDLKQLIADNKFREDLYYRLVHRTITIPPLRERKEDISALINYFTIKFCREADKKIRGYSVKASEALQNYCWKGNVRQLENEIRSIVNLTDDSETVGYDILSDEIKESPQETVEVKPISEEKIIPGKKLDAETEKKVIRELLETNAWNKSQTARELGITYRGLHKKLKRLGIDGPEQ